MYGCGLSIHFPVIARNYTKNPKSDVSLYYAYEEAETIIIQENCINLVYLQYNSKKMVAEVNPDRHESQQLTDEMQPANHRRMNASTDHNVSDNYLMGSGVLCGLNYVNNTFP
jgi:hypothetical protein